MESRVVVVRPFGTHARGDILTDRDETNKILASEHAVSVVRVSAVVPAVLPGSTNAGTNGAKAEEN